MVDTSSFNKEKYMTNTNLKFKLDKKITFKELEPTSNKDVINNLKSKTSTVNVKLLVNNKKKAQSTGILNIVKHLSSKTINLIIKKSGDSDKSGKSELTSKFKKIGVEDLSSSENNNNDNGNIRKEKPSNIIDIVDNYSDDEYLSDKDDDNVIPVRKIASKTSSKRTIYDKLVVEMEENFEAEMVKNFIDSKYNLSEYFEQYLIRNLKVIKRMQFFFNQDIYDQLYNFATDRFLKLNEEKFKFDYDSPYLFIDLDETLVHTEEFCEIYKDLYDATFTIPYIDENKEEKLETFGIYLRPFCIEFLEYAKKHFKLVIYTAAEEKYAQFVLSSLKIDKYFECILDRSFTIQVKNFYIKDLSIFNKNAKLNCLLIDNNVFSLANSLQQGILVTSFYKCKEDTEFEELISYLKDNIVENIPNMMYVNDEYHMYRELMVKLDYETEVE